MMSGSGLLILSAALFYPIGVSAGGGERIYERDSGHLGGGTVKVVLVDEKSAQARLTVQVGGIPNGEATSSDCGFIAEGKLRGDAFNGVITRINVVTDLAPDGDPAGSNIPALVAVVKPDLVTFDATSATISKFCGGDGSSLDGSFHRED